MPRGSLGGEKKWTRQLARQSLVHSVSRQSPKTLRVVAQDVIVRGLLIGSVRALTVTLEANSHVEADLFHKSLSLEQGTHFDGDSHPSEDPLSSSPEVCSAETQLNQKGSESVKRHGRVNGFVRTLGESLSA